MKTQLKKFLAGLKESDFLGSQTNSAIKEKAEKFLNSGAYKYNESYKRGEETYDIHNSLLCLIYDEI